MPMEAAGLDPLHKIGDPLFALSGLGFHLLDDLLIARDLILKLFFKPRFFLRPSFLTEDCL